jgi:transposase
LAQTQRASKDTKDTFLLEYSRNGDHPEIKQKIIDMALNGSGIRDTARVLGVSMNTVISF